MDDKKAIGPPMYCVFDCDPVFDILAIFIFAMTYLVLRFVMNSNVVNQFLVRRK